MEQSEEDYMTDQEAINGLADRALHNRNNINYSETFHIVWNPFGPTNPRYAFANYEDAEALAVILRRRFAEELHSFFVMSHNYHE